MNLTNLITKMSFEYRPITGFPVKIEFKSSDPRRWSFSTGNETSNLSTSDLANIYNIMQLVEKING